MNSVSRPVIIIGSGRSGTTLISEIFFRHRALAFPSNYSEKFPAMPKMGFIRNFFDNNLWRVFGSKEQSINPVSVFNKILFTPSEAWTMWDQVTGLGDGFSRGFLLGQRADEQQALRVINYFSEMLKWQNRDRLAMKLTGPARLEYLTSIFSNPLFIYITRKPVPTVSSFLQVPFWQKQGLKSLWWKGAYSEAELDMVEANRMNGVWMTAFQLKKLADTTRKEKELVNASFLEIRFEEFVANPKEMLTRMFDFSGLDVDKHCFNYLTRNKIVSRNLHDTSYFSNRDLDIIYSIFGMEN